MTKNNEKLKAELNAAYLRITELEELVASFKIEK